MLVVSTREFRDKQRSYLDRVDAGTELLIQRRRNKSYRIVPVTENDTVLSKEEYFARLERGFQNFKEGKGRTYTLEELHEKMGL